jgi:hypothetical protein
MVEPDSPEPRLTPDNDPKQTTRKRTSASRAKKGQEDNAAPDAPGEKKNVRATREDKGIPRLEERDLIVLRWVLQMYAVRFDQLQVLLARHSPKKEELADPEHVSPSTVRTHLRRWKALGLVVYKKILADKDNPLWCWITPYGLKFLAEEDQHGEAIIYTYYAPKEKDLKHLYLINQARLYIERSYPEYTFKSERQLRREQSARPKAIKQKHFTDGLVYRPDGRAIALEVERWDKGAERLEGILQELARSYHRTWYFVSKKARTAVKKAYAKLPEEERRRIQVLSSEVKLLGQPAEEEDQMGEVTEE